MQAEASVLRSSSAECGAQGSCSDDDLYQFGESRNGDPLAGCLLPFSVDDYGGVYCDDTNQFYTQYGCGVAPWSTATRGSMVEVHPGSVPARPLCLVSARLTALDGSALPE